MDPYNNIQSIGMNTNNMVPQMGQIPCMQNPQMGDMSQIPVNNGQKIPLDQIGKLQAERK